MKMTREQAIEELEELSNYVGLENTIKSDRRLQALDMAIEALKGGERERSVDFKI